MDYLNEEKEDTVNLTINKEERAFTNVLFYRFIEKSNKVEDVSALHYAQSVEILFCENVTGQATIGTKVFNLRGKELFFIAPNVIHSTTYFSKKDSRVYVFQLSLEHLKPLFDVEQCFRASNKSLYNIREYIPECYDEVFQIISKEICEKKSIIEKVGGVAHLFSCLESKLTDAPTEKTGKTDKIIQQIIAWTEKHFTETFTIDHVAEKMFLSKYYFCHYFKKYTGKTYIDYVHELRISRAILMMRQGCFLTECCFACGFNDLSYFTRVFKKMTGYTPSRYRKEFLT